MEDLLAQLAKVEYLFGGRDRKFIRSVSNRSAKGEPLTTRQGWAFIAILKNTQFYRELGMTKKAFNDLLASPKWKTALVPSVELKSEARYLGDNLMGFRTSNGRTEIEFASMKAIYSNGMKIIPIETTAVLNAVIEFIGKWGFDVDASTEQYLADAMKYTPAPTQVILMEDQMVFDVPNQHPFAQFAHHVLGAQFV